MTQPGLSIFRLRDALTEAAAAVAQRPIRTLLTALGTILGVGAFVATTGLVETARAQVSARFDALKATQVRVEDSAPDGINPFPDDVDHRLEALNGVNHAGVLFPLPNADALQARATATRQASAAGSVPVVAASPGAVQAALPIIAIGRPFNDFHQRTRARVALLGRVAARQLGIQSIDDQPVVFLGDEAYAVIGILDDVQRNPDLVLAVLVPESTATQDFDVRNAEREVLIDTAQGAAQLIGSQAALALRPQDPGRLRTLVPPDPTTLRNKVESDVESLFYALSALALLIGAVAITNASLLNIIERRPEIGLRRALGATRRHISRQVTLEAALVGTLAGVFGTTVGVVAISAGSIARGWTPTLQPAALAIAPLIGIATGTAAGLLPALKASRTPPAETLRQ